ncbi:MAG TPA: hypothetical protein VIN36_03100 [Thiobacillus sp.]
MSKNRDSMTPARWAAIRSTSAPAGNYIHISCTAQMVPDPTDPNAPWIPMVSAGKTYHAGRNASKRKDRRADIRARAAARRIGGAA